MIRNGEGALEAAAGRLQRAVETLEQRLEALSRAESSPPVGDGQLDAVRADLRSARERERALEAAAAEASATLGRAADQIRTALEEDEPEREVETPSGDGRPDLDALSDDLTDLHQPRSSHRNGDA